METSRPTSATPVTKLLTIIVENHSSNEMRSGMPKLFARARRYSYATNYRALRHPSLPNYLAIATGSTQGVTNDDPPAKHHIHGNSVFDAAINVGKTAKTYADSMTRNCQQSAAEPYAVKHNPWAYMADPAQRKNCSAYDVPIDRLNSDVRLARLPTAGMIIPDLCHDAHDCSLSTADAYIDAVLTRVLAGPDFTSGRLAVIVVADEDDSSQSNTVLAVVLAKKLDNSHKVVTTALTHYSLTRLYAQVAGTSALGAGASAPNLKAAFGL